MLRAAIARKTLTYGYLMRKFHLSRGAGIVGVIGEIDRYEASREAPGFAAIVVRKDTGHPGGGFFCWDDVPHGLRRPRGQGLNPKLSEAETRYVQSLQEEIWRFYGRASRPGRQDATLSP